MPWTPRTVIRWLLDGECGPGDRFVARWIVLRALGLIYFSAFFSLVFQILGLIGPQGIFPAGQYLEQVSQHYGSSRYFYAPTLAWISSGPHMLLAWCWIGMIAALLVTINFWPRGMLLICFLCFLSFIGAAGEFSEYQSDGMLLEMGFLALFFAPAGFWPRWGIGSPPSRASYFLLQWEWFRIYFESGIGKLLSHDPSWRNFTAMDQYYQNGPLPTWIGWYVQHLPHGFQAATVALTLALEIGLVWLAWLPRRWHTPTVLFFIVTPWEIGIILTANYAFLNYLVLTLGFLLLDDGFLARFVPERYRRALPISVELARGELGQVSPPVQEPSIADLSEMRATPGQPQAHAARAAPPSPGAPSTWQQFRPHLKALWLSVSAVLLGLIFYDTTVELLWMLFPHAPFPTTPVLALEPFRIANQYGLFEVMTPDRYEIEFQGSDDGMHWTPYPFRYKPQDVSKPPGIYAPYQPRFDWNLWFASLSDWRRDPITIRTEEALLGGSKDVLQLFASNPFVAHPPKYIRAVLWQYWFSTPQQKHTQGVWWTRRLLGYYAPPLELGPDGKFAIPQNLEPPTSNEPPAGPKP
jgi:lipase maturation factor 1